MRAVPFLLATSALLAAATVSKADLIPYSNIGSVAPTQTIQAATTGYVTAYLIQAGAASGGSELYVDSIRLVDLTSNYTSPWVFSSQVTPAGAEATLGPVTQGDVLALQIQAQVYDNSLHIFSSLPSQSEDGANHVYLTPFSGGLISNVNLPAGMYAGFEDTNVLTNDHAANINYIDVTTVFQNITVTPATSPVPEPGTLTLLGTGALGVAGALRRRVRR